MSQFDSYYNKSGGGGGGGYLPNSPFNTASPGGAQKSEHSGALLPMTIAQLNKATQAHSDSVFMLDEREIRQVTIVGVVSSIQQQATNSVYAIDDGTGRIEARQWVNSVSEAVQSDIKENIYVRVTGPLQAFHGKRYINARHIRPVAEPHEVYFHILEAVAVTLSLERGVPFAPGSLAARSKDVVMTDASAYNAGDSSRISSDQYSHLPALQQSIVRFLKENCKTDEGIHVSAIARAVGNGSDAIKISDALDTLMDNGLVYTTLDESHFILA
ncbi:replication protein A, subunit RPA32 [Coprinopsis marcescibilis]|uniref:Replication protein A, subunit RPA32 n=1 Tax=Coprinopsis marcescibilis TaxID=230819 RepID=A0A5C3LBJ4_COPMA|nr:replication protein A, subunit RPA32 [Coprinopsis marcescibilis]